MCGEKTSFSMCLRIHLTFELIAGVRLISVTLIKVKKMVFFMTLQLEVFNGLM